MTTTGVVTEFSIPTTSSGVSNITIGPDGNLWFIEETAASIGRITTAGIITEFVIPGAIQPRFITAGPDGNVWFTEQGSNKIGQILLDKPPVPAVVPTMTELGMILFAVIAGPMSLYYLKRRAKGVSINTGEGQ